jgi:hypothetical protein
MPADRKILAAVFAAILMLSAGPARAAVARPTPTAPAEGAVSQFLPAFAWTKASGADRYEFQIAADAGMNSPVLGQGKDDFLTRNTRATLVKTVPNGTYWWRVRSVAADGSVSAWTSPRSFTKNWNLQPALQTPGDGQTLSFPANPVVLRWSGVAGAAHYLVSVASDPALGSLVLKYSNQDDLNGPPNVAANSAAITAALAPGTYYWAVQPVDAEGNRGVPTPVASFGWVWPSATTPVVTDLDPSAEVFDPKFSWGVVPGAVAYEVEVNPSADFAPGSKVCCAGTTIANSLSPTKVFKDNLYHWRVRAIDPDGNAGVWNVGQDFQKTFDNVPPVTAPSVKNLHMRDNLNDPGTDLDTGTPGYQTQVPVVVWNPVHGASSYEADVTLYQSGACNWSAVPNTPHWRVNTAVSAWTPLGDHWNNVKPYSDPLSVANDGSITLTPGSYCVRVRARTDRDTANQDVYGDYTYLDDGTGRGTAFDFTGYPDGGGCSSTCTVGFLGGSDYAAPASGTLTRATPYFTWKPLRRKAWIMLKNSTNADALLLTAHQEGSWGSGIHATVANDGSNSAHDVLTLSGGPCGTKTYSYSDNDLDSLATQVNADGSGCVDATRPGSSPPPGPLAYVSNVAFWPGITSYFVLVSKDANFTTIVDYGFTHVAAYAPRTANQVRSYSDESTSYYWAVLPAQDYNGSLAVGNPLLAHGDDFQKQSLPPSLLYPSASQLFYDQPTFQWSPVEGARRYHFQVASDPSFSNLLDDVLTDATSYSSNVTYPADTVLYWRVRADDENLVGLTWSPFGMFQKKLEAPTPSTSNPASGDMLPVWAWSPVQGASSYDISIDGPDGRNRYFSGFRAPAVSFIKMTGTGVFHWRVRAEFPTTSGSETPGPYSATQAFTRTIGQPTNTHTDSDVDHVLLSWDPRLGAKEYKVQIASTPDFSRNIEQTTTDNASYAPTMTQYGYNAGGTLYWRVSAVDEDHNQGDWSSTGQIQMLPRMRLSVSGTPRHRKRSRFTIRVEKFAGGALAKASVRVTGPGMRGKSGRTNARGKLTLYLKPGRKGTKLTFRATKAGYQAAYVTVKVR